MWNLGHRLETDFAIRRAIMTTREAVRAIVEDAADRLGLEGFESSVDRTEPAVPELRVWEIVWIPRVRPNYVFAFTMRPPGSAARTPAGHA